MTNNELHKINQLGFGPQITEINARNYWSSILGSGGPGGLQLNGVYDSKAEMETAIGNPPDPQYIGLFFAYLNADGITWTVVKVKA